MPKIAYRLPAEQIKIGLIDLIHWTNSSASQTIPLKLDCYEGRVNGNWFALRRIVQNKEKRWGKFGFTIRGRIKEKEGITYLSFMLLPGYFEGFMSLLWFLTALYYLFWSLPFIQIILGEGAVSLLFVSKWPLLLPLVYFGFGVARIYTSYRQSLRHFRYTLNSLFVPGEVLIPKFQEGFFHDVFRHFRFQPFWGMLLVSISVCLFLISTENQLFYSDEPLFNLFVEQRMFIRTLWLTHVITGFYYIQWLVLNYRKESSAIQLFKYPFLIYMQTLLVFYATFVIAKIALPIIMIFREESVSDFVLGFPMLYVIALFSFPVFFIFYFFFLILPQNMFGFHVNPHHQPQYQPIPNPAEKANSAKSGKESKIKRFLTASKIKEKKKWYEVWKKD